MLGLSSVAIFLGSVLAASKDAFDLGNTLFGNLVAVTGDAHQSKVAQDIFRQEIRYERSLQIREDIRDVNNLMLESVQAHLFMGSILLGSTFSMFIEGYPPVGTDRTVAAFWTVFTAWASTYTLLSIWLALRFQGKISTLAKERLLLRHRFVMPDDRVVGRMGGGNLVNEVANLHFSVIGKMNELMNTPDGKKTTTNEPTQVTRKERLAICRMRVQGGGSGFLDAEPLRPGMHGFLHPTGKGLASPTIIDAPYFLHGETLVRLPWHFHGTEPFMIKVFGQATLYIAAQVPPIVGHEDGAESVRKALRLGMTVPEWPADELPLVVRGFHPDWRGESGYGEFKRVEGFSIHVDDRFMELPIYKIVLADPREGVDYVRVIVQWKFKMGCNAPLVVVRQAQVHCREEDWPTTEFNEEIRRIVPLRDFAGQFLKSGLSCLFGAAICTFIARQQTYNDYTTWWYEVILCVVAFIPALVVIRVVPVQMNILSGQSSLFRIEQNTPKRHRPSENLLDVTKPVKPALPAGLMAINHSTMSLSTEDIEGPLAEPTSTGAPDGEGVLQAGFVSVAESERLEPISGMDARLAPEDTQVDPLDRELPEPVALVVPTSPWWASPAEGLEEPGSRGSSPPRTQRPPFGTVGANHRRLGGGAILAAEGPSWLGNCVPAPAQARCTEIIQVTNDYVQQQVEGQMPDKPTVALRKKRRTPTVVSLVTESEANSERAEDAAEDTCDVVSVEVADSPNSIARIRRNHTSRITVMEDIEMEQPSLKSRVLDALRPLVFEEAVFDSERTVSSLESATRTLTMWNNCLRGLFAGSMLLVMIGSVTFFKPVERETLGGGLGPARKQLSWSSVDVVWPPFFQPRALHSPGAGQGLLATDGRALWWLRHFAGQGASTPMVAQGRPLLLTNEASGLGPALDAAHVAVVSDAGTYEVDVAALVVSSPALSAGSLQLGFGGVVNATATPLQLPAGAFPLLAASAFVTESPPVGAESSSQASESQAALVAGQDDNLYLCLLFQGSSGEGSNVPLRLYVQGGNVQNTTALYVCPSGRCAAEPVLWLAVNGGQSITAIGLASGRSLDTFAAPVGAKASVVAMAGTDSHLIVATVVDSEAALLLSTAYPGLPS